jgi:hypothetical protein
MCFTVHMSTVDIAICYGLDDRGVRVRALVEARFSSSPQYPDRFWGHPECYPMITGDLFTGGKVV